jgi:hypothetical protein|tara:strand:- start:1116 stop:1301 length:186 start_codon:yes stop_codon:yes gene_type:complete
VDEINRDALLIEVQNIILSETEGYELTKEAHLKMDRLEAMLENALGINEDNTKRSINYGLS